MANATHEGVSCDGCMTPNFGGNRYKCLRCYDFDLCHACFSANRFTAQLSGSDSEPHTRDHPMQCVLTRRDFEVIYEGDPLKNYDVCKVVIFTCPYCGVSGFNHKTLYEHLTRTHPDPPSDIKVICPMCVGSHNVNLDGNRSIDNLKVHWNQSHSDLDSSFRPSESSRTTQRRPMLTRRTGRQPAGNPRNGTATVAQAAAAQFGMPWNSDLTDVDDMFRMVNLARHLPPLPTSYAAAAAATDAARLGNAAYQSTNLLSSARGATTSSREYAAPRGVPSSTSARSSVPAVQVLRPLHTTPIYPPVYDDASHADTDTLDEMDSESEVDVDEELLPIEGEHAEGREGEAGSDSEYEIADDARDEASSEDETLRILEETVPLASDVDPPSADPTAPLSVDIASDPMSALRAVCNPAEWANVLSVLSDQEEPELEGDDEHQPLLESRSVTPRDDGESPDQQCWLSLQVDTSQIAGSQGGYWSDKRFLRQRKMVRNMSTTGETEQCVEKAELAAALVAALVTDRMGDAREYDRTGRSLRRVLRTFNLNGELKSSISANEESEDVVSAASRRLDSDGALSPAGSREPAEAPVAAVVEVPVEPAVENGVAAAAEAVAVDSEGESSEDGDESTQSSVRALRDDSIAWFDDSESRS